MAGAADLVMDSLVVREIRQRDEWNALVVGLPHYDLRQGYEWGEVMTSQGWIPHRLAAFQGTSCVAAVSILAKPLPVIGRSILHAPAGPLLSDARNDSAWDGLLEGIRRVAADTSALFLRVSPWVPNDDEETRHALVTRGFKHLHDDWTTWNVPRIGMTLDLREPEEVLKARLRKRYREYITSASRQGVRVKWASSLEDARSFHMSLASAGRRKGLPVRGRAYFERLWKEYLQAGQGVLLVAEYQGETVGGLLGARLGQKAHMLYVALPQRRTADTVHQGPLLYWEFIRWAKNAGCATIDWGGVGTNYPPREDDPGFGVYHFKLGFNSSLQYLSGYYDLVFSQRFYAGFRAFEPRVSAIAWTARAKLNGSASYVRTLMERATSKARKLQVSVAQRGVGTTLYWAAFSYLRPNRLLVFERHLDKEVAWTPPDGVTFRVSDAGALRTWRQNRTGLPPEFFQDEIDGVATCVIAQVGDDVAGLIWIYRSEDKSNLSRLSELEAELNQGCVLREYQGRGIFKGILHSACIWLREEGYRAAYALVHSTNLPSLRAFRGTGFREIGAVRQFLMYRPKFRRKGRAPRSGAGPARALGRPRDGLSR